MNKHFTVKDLTVQAIIASIYVVLVLVLPWISFGASLQLRVAEALLILVFFNKKNAIGLVIGTFIANLNSPYGISDAIFGSVATLLVVSSLMISKKYWYITLLIFPALINGVIVAGIDAFITNTFANFIIFGISVALGELVVVAILGIPLKLFLSKNESIKDYIE